MEHTPSLDLMDSLKEAVRDRHLRMEGLPIITALVDRTLPFASYVEQLRAMAVIHGTLEHEQSLMEGEGAQSPFLGRPSRLVHLRRDLSRLDTPDLPINAPVLDHTRQLAAQIRQWRVEDPRLLLGVLYVLEGMTLGNAVHLKDVHACFEPERHGPAHYYAGYGDQTGSCWLAFKAAMNAVPMDQPGIQRLIQVAHGCFDHLERLFAALHPLQAAGQGFAASLLNPEAGDHGVPADALEIRAAVAAASRCREEFPYFDERYQERGRSFGKSDAAWLVTLTELPELELLSQVEWLGRVLANRGMPRLTLERQLELLHEELTEVLPENRARYEGLLKAADHLRAERLRSIPEALTRELAREFRAATEGECPGRLGRTAALITSAVADEAGGMEKAATSLLSWLTDPARFSLRWIEAVRRTEDRARQGLLP